MRFGQLSIDVIGSGVSLQSTHSNTSSSQPWLRLMQVYDHMDTKQGIWTHFWKSYYDCVRQAQKTLQRATCALSSSPASSQCLVAAKERPAGSAANSGKTNVETSHGSLLVLNVATKPASKNCSRPTPRRCLGVS
jgi:hypothetical protein